MKRTRLFVKRYWFELSIALLICIAIFFRFYNYQNRWGLSYDQARDVIVAQEAIQSHRIPLIGPFSSAGQFVYGPQWYWILMLCVSIFPNWILSAWVIQTSVYVGMVFLMIMIGNILYGKHFGLLLGLLTAISPAQIAQSTNLTSPSMVGLFSMLSIYCFLRFITIQSPLFAILLGFCVGTAINVHFQAFGLLFLLPVATLCSKNKINYLFLMIVGFALPFLPLLIFDFRTNFFESKNFLDYYFYGQHKIYVPNRWLTYAGIFWPNAWARIIGGYSIVSWSIILSLTIYLCTSIIKRTISKLTFALVGAFLCSFVMLRYFKGNLYDGYLVFLHPYILILTGLAIRSVYYWKKLLGILLIVLIVISSIYVVLPEILHARNEASIRAKHWMNLLIETYPNNKFLLYDYRYKNTGFSLPLVLYLNYQKKLDDDGYRIGFGNIDALAREWHTTVLGNKMGFEFLDLQSSSSAVLKENLWADVNPSMIYHSTVEWYKDRTF